MLSVTKKEKNPIARPQMPKQLIIFFLHLFLYNKGNNNNKKEKKKYHVIFQPFWNSLT